MGNQSSKTRLTNEERLSNELNLMRVAIDSLPDYVWSKDAEGRFVLANIALARHMGAATVDDLIGKTDFDFYPPELAAQFCADEQALIASGQTILDHEEATQDTAGNPKWTLTTKVLLRDSESKFIGSTGVSRDITARKVAEAELARQRYILDTFMENIPDRVYFKDMDSRITRANKAHAIHLGLSDPAEEISKSDFDFFPEEQARPKYEQEQEVIRTGRPILNLEEVDSRGRWALTTKMPLRDENGKIIGTFGISRDITALKQAQAALEKAYADVEQQVAARTAELEREVAERERAQEESARLQQEVIEAQKQAIQELSTPIIPILEGVIVMPLIGSIDTLRARDVTCSLLAGIREHKARVVILDITGVPIVDSGVATYLNKTIQAAQLKGARTIVTGISEAVAETIVDLGIDWSHIETVADLQNGLRAVLSGRRGER
ncbi:MAG: PAS domain-containing protein [Thermoflexales bacterium]|nr:PAS domain-containing protein [Thermoflexales bacterium]